MRVKTMKIKGLIFRPHEDPIPQHAVGKYLWVEILGVEIVEITDYH